MGDKARTRKGAKEWAPEELDDIKTNCVNMTVNAIRQRFSCSDQAVLRAFDTIGRPYEPFRPRWTPEMDDMLLSLAVKHKVKKVAAKLNKTELSILMRLRRIAPDVVCGGNKTDKKYSDAENATIIEKWGCVGVSWIAKELGRKASGVRQQAYKLGLSPIGVNDIEDNDVWLSMPEFISGTGISRDVVLRWAKELGAPAHYRKNTAATKAGWQINMPKMLNWLKDHQSEWDGSKVESLLFVPEPEWLKQKRKDDSRHLGEIKHYKRIKAWSKEELNWLKVCWEMRRSEAVTKEGLPDRSLTAMRAKQADLGYREPKKKQWTTLEIHYIKENWQTKSDRDIAEHLGCKVSQIEAMRFKYRLLRGNIGRPKRS